MKLFSPISLFLGASLLFLTACDEPPNPLMGKWQHTAPTADGEAQEIVEFTPSTMIIDGRRVTVVYQLRPDKVRVSASKQAIVYNLIDADTISYSDDDSNVVTLRRVE